MALLFLINNIVLDPVLRSALCATSSQRFKRWRTKPQLAEKTPINCKLCAFMWESLTDHCVKEMCVCELDVDVSSSVLHAHEQIKHLL